MTRRVARRAARGVARSIVLRNRRKNITWDKLGRIGCRWQLESFEGSSPGTWDMYLASQRKRWGADRTNKERFHRQYGEADPEAGLLKDSQLGFEEWSEYLLHWNGLCQIGESIHVIPMNPNVIVLSKDRAGAIRDHADLKVGILEERTVLRQHVRLLTEIYSFGTFTAPTALTRGSAKGGPLVSHREGEDQHAGDTITLIRDGTAVQIASAIFAISS